MAHNLSPVSRLFGASTAAQHAALRPHFDAPSDDAALPVNALNLVWDEVCSSIEQAIVVVGDCLLMDVLQDPTVDLSHGGQMLQILHMCEAALDRLGYGGRQVRVLFFEASECIWAHDPFLKLLRQTLQERLSQSERFSCDVYPNWWGDFPVALENKLPAFIVVNNGLAPLNAPTIPGYSAEAPVVDTLQHFILHMLLSLPHMSFVRLTELSLDSNEAMIYRLTGVYLDPAPRIKALELLEANPPKAVATQDAKADGAVTQKLALAISQPRLLLAAAAAVPMLRGKPNAFTVELVKLLLLHSVLLERLSLSQRAQALPTTTEPLFANVAAFLNQTCMHMVAARSGVEAHPTLADAIDGRMFHKLLLLAREYPGAVNAEQLGEDVAKTVDGAWMAVRAAAGFKGNFFPLLDKKGHASLALPAPGARDGAQWKKEPLKDHALSTKLYQEYISDAKPAVEEEKEEKTEEAPKKKSSAAKPAGEIGEDDEEVRDDWDAESVPDDWDASSGDEEDADKPAEEAAAEPAADADAAPAEEKEEEEVIDCWVYGGEGKFMCRLCDEVCDEKAALHHLCPALEHPAHFRLVPALSPESNVAPEMDSEHNIEVSVSLESSERMQQTLAMHLKQQAASMSVAKVRFRDVVVHKVVKKKKVEDVVLNKKGKKGKKGKSDEVAPSVVLAEAMLLDTFQDRANLLLSAAESGRTTLDAQSTRVLMMWCVGSSPETFDAAKKLADTLMGGAGGLNVREQAAVRAVIKPIVTKTEEISRAHAVAQAYQTMEQRITALEKIVDDSALKLVELDAEIMSIPLSMTLVNMYQSTWEDAQRKRSHSRQAISKAIRLYQGATSTFRRHLPDLSPKQVRVIQQAIFSIGCSDFQSAADGMCETYAAQFGKDKAAMLAKVKVKGQSAFNFGLTYTDFQLQHAGHVLVRDVNSTADKRISFYPDGWQKELLDYVDERKSVLVVAPTSSGKTFISYYCMNAILKNNENSENPPASAVYVAPTKSLINQASADLHGRYPKASIERWTTQGITGEIGRCEILLTTPDNFEKLLIAPEWNPFVERLKRGYAILDEVHCMGEEGGEVWERALVMLPCPFLALSATLANKEPLAEWLNKLHNDTVRVVTHPTRWSHLNSFVYAPRHGYKTEEDREASCWGERENVSNSELHSVHPIAALSQARDVLGENGMYKALAHISLAPKDTLALLSYMIAVLSDLKHKDLDAVRALGSNRVLGGQPYISMRDVNTWTQTVKDKLMKFEPSVFQEIVTRMEQEWANRIAPAMTANPDTSMRAVAKDFTDMLRRLDKEDFLPAIIFSSSAQNCEDLVKGAVLNMEEAEALDRKKNEDPAKIQRIKEELRTLTTEIEHVRRQLDNNKDSAEIPALQSKISDLRDRKNHLEKLLNPGVDERFAFGSLNRENKDIYYWLARLEKKMCPDGNLDAWNENWWLRALKRGIGIHHPGLVAQYRELVEMAFRRGLLKVVVTDYKTLSYGINMPCRTTVFAGDSMFLTSLLYQQCAGRAGRRGFDYLGQVVFHGVSKRKLSMLMTSGLPTMYSSFYLDPILQLRLVCANEGERSEHYKRLVREPYFDPSPSRHENYDAKVAHIQEYMAWSNTYMLQLGYVDHTGQPTAIGRIASHMFERQAGAMHFCELLRRGYLHTICAGDDMTEKAKTKRAAKLLEVLSNVFLLLPLRPDRAVQDVEGQYIQVPPLSGPMAEAMDTVNDHALTYFTQYMAQAKDQPANDVTPAFPFSSAQFPVEGVTAPKSSLVGMLADAAVPVAVRSAMYATSKPSDTFTTATELRKTAKRTVPETFPVLRLEDILGRPYALNAYAINFFHNDIDAVAKYNGISGAYVWELLNRWNVLMSEVARALDEVMEDPKDPVKTLLLFLQENFNRRLTGGKRQYAYKPKRFRVGTSVQWRDPSSRRLYTCKIARVISETDEYEIEFRREQGGGSQVVPVHEVRLPVLRRR